ncbi:MAG: ABC transporter permease [Acidobacteria bacterium]|nr:ABC transporter permease [Acidobacteriota bacterium]
MSERAAEWVIAADARDRVGDRAAEVWQYRQILWFFSLKALRTLYSKTHLGVWWIFLRTLIPLLVGSFVYGSVMNIASGGVPYLVFFLAGQVPWSCFDGPLVRGSRGLEINRQLLVKLYVPRIILPLGGMTPGLVEPAIVGVVLLCTLAYYRINEGIWYVSSDPRPLVAVAAMVLVLAFTFSVTLFTSVWQARARDARFVLRYVVGFWVFFTPVIYPLSQVPAELRWLMHLNPLTAPVETFKWAVLPGLEHSWAWLCYTAAITVVMFLAGVRFFMRAESETMDKI